jgi:predicted GNAT superfamily acetyltransferase
MKDVDVTIRRARGLEDYDAVVELQKQIWGYTALEDIASQPMLMIANRFGGSVLVAEAAGRVVGFSFAKPGWSRAKKPLWWSHMTAVIPEYRGKDLGLRLKLKQRDEALNEGIDRVLWTFDPLQALNANFNIHRLGAIVREYEENIYGMSLSPLHRGLPTDRFVAEWHLNSERVQERVGVAQTSVIMRDLDRIPRIEGTFTDESPLLLEIPVDVSQLKQSDLAAARAWQDRLRAACVHYFKEGYAVTDFVRLDKPREEAFYVLEKA